ncbi:Atu4866 domain-containing protein [Neomesorhizobium albiziae]|nr:Atu4866 domain-containing protein [Mesorhizobium albiziae]GLS29285.1 hypothetical protein GCM10007937_09930 [Mesorhizobium albiziae]
MRYTETRGLAGAIAAAMVIFGPVASDQGRSQATGISTPKPENSMKNHPYVGMWVTADGHVRQELLANGRYDEARGARKSAYQGRYQVTGSHIDYWDDTGFTADGTFVDGVLYHGGMVFYRER